MTVTIDPSEVRAEASARPAPAKAAPRLPLKTVLLAGIGGTALVAFTVGAFSFFSTLADPRPRKFTPMPVAAAMPDLKDGLPALVEGETQKTATFNLPRPNAAEPAAPAQPPAQQAAATPPAPEPASAAVQQAAVPAPIDKPAPMANAAPVDPQVPALRTGPTPPPIQNAAIVAPPERTVATIAPARIETVKAKPVQAAAIAPAAPSHEPAPVAEPTSTATVTAPPPASPAHRAVAAKPAVQKAAARKATTARTAAAEPEDAAVAAPPAASSDDSDIPGARQFKAGVKAITGIFGGDTKDD